MRVLLHRDGLLHRFGRPVPDAVGLVAELQRLVAGLRRRPRAGSRDAEVELAALDVEWEREREPEPGPPESARATAADGGVTGRLGAEVGAVSGGGAPEKGSAEGETPGGVDTVGDAFADLPLTRASWSDLSADGDLLFTASHAVLAAARAAGLAAFRVGTGVGGEGGAADDEALGFADVPRRVEEALRLPTARPMAAAARTGGLLAIPAASAAAARDEALAAVRQDPHADWVRTAGHLLLYTEDPDLEDRLAKRSGVERLSYGVHLGDLTFAPAEARVEAGEEASEETSAESRQGSLFTGDGIVLRADGRAGSPGSAPPRVSEPAPGRGDGAGGGAPRRGHPAESSRRAAPPDAADGPTRPTASATGPAETSAGGPPWSWSAVRRGTVPPAAAPAAPQPSGGERPGADLDPDLGADFDADLDAAYRAELARLLKNFADLDGDADTDSLLAAVRRYAGAGSAADLRPATTAPPHPALLAWQTPFTDPARDDLAVVLHPPLAASPTTAGAADRPGTSRALASALAASALLRRLPSAPGTLHLLPLAPPSTTPTSPPGPLAAAAPFLLADEPHRVHHVLDLSASAPAEAPPAALTALTVPPPPPAAAGEPENGS